MASNDSKRPVSAGNVKAMKSELDAKIDAGGGVLLFLGSSGTANLSQPITDFDLISVDYQVNNCCFSTVFPGTATNYVLVPWLRSGSSAVMSDFINVSATQLSKYPMSYGDPVFYRVIGYK